MKNITINFLLFLSTILGTNWTTEGFSSPGKVCYTRPQRQQQTFPQVIESSSIVADNFSSESISRITLKSTSKDAAASADGEDNNNNNKDEETVDVEVIEFVPSELGTAPTSRVQTFRRKFFKKDNTKDDGLTFRQRLAKAGLSVVLSYGWVSNMSYCFTVSAAWYIFTKRTGLSPLAPGQWKGFLAVYAGFYVFNNIIRPIRFGISMGVSVYFDNIIAKIQDIFKVKKGVAIFITVFLANIVGTCSLMALGIFLASLASGVPIFVPKV